MLALIILVSHLTRLVWLHLGGSSILNCIIQMFGFGEGYWSPARYDEEK